MNRRKGGQGGGEGKKKKHNQKQTPHCLKKLCGLHIHHAQLTTQIIMCVSNDNNDNNDNNVC